MLSYQMQGKEGIPMVLIHAFPLSSEMWNGEIEAFSERNRVIVPDLPGFGRSALTKKTSIAEMAQEINELLYHLGIEEPIFIGGLSMGGYVALEFMRQFPDRTRALGLFSTRATVDTLEAREKRMQTIEEIEKEGFVPFVEKTVSSLLGKSSIDEDPDLVNAVTAMVLRNHVKGTVNALQAMASRRDSTDLLNIIECPVLILAGSEDQLILSSEGEWMHQRILSSTFEVISCSGHLINLEKPAAFHMAIARFLELKVFEHHITN